MHVAGLVSTGSCACVAGSLWLGMEERVPLALGWDTRLAQTTSVGLITM